MAESAAGPSPVFVFLHGFASSPLSRKARFFGEKLAARGVRLEVPDLNEGEGGFTGLTLSRAVAQTSALLDRAGADERGAVLLGSSFGGYTAALLAARDRRVRAQVLMAPGFELAGNWADRLGPDLLATWRTQGYLELPHHATGKAERIGFSLYRDALGHSPYPPAPCPTLVIHGRNDATVPIGTARRFASREPGTVRLVELDSDHELLDSMQRLWDEASAFLAPWLPSPAPSAGATPG